MKSNVPLSQQIACVKREIAMREKVYPALVYKGKMRQVEADWQLTTMQAVLKTLETLQKNGDAR